MQDTNPGAQPQFTDAISKQTLAAEDLKDVIVEALLEKKAKEIVILDVHELTTLTDLFIVCHGTSDTQIRALSGHVMEEVKKKLGEQVWQREGLESRKWIILDYVNVVVHIFSKEKREYYGIEKMWNDADITEITESADAQS